MHTVANLAFSFNGAEGTLPPKKAIFRFQATAEESLRATCQTENVKCVKHATGYNLEGDWGHVIEIMRICREVVLERHQGGDMNAPQFQMSITMGTRLDKHSTLENKLESVEKKAQNLKDSM
ncbi:hypothetical protein BDR26DRAFT_856015 [Obelidium mucronatum]|nr:hypothetical protein BDR26DRAFT_856015 [Obelidium mucronatum]